MSARARASRAFCRLAAIFTVAVAAKCDISGDISCNRDGLYADYDTDCREYVRCSGGSATGRYSCGPGRAFSEVAGSCVPRRQQPCVRRVCAPGDTLAYATPDTACRHYYRCENGTAVEHACPSGAWFDLERQACTRGAGTCYEPLCAGLPDGDYPDSSHDCRRTLRCRGAELREVFSCGGPCDPTATCPPPRSAAIPLPAGDADFCSDETCSSLCQHAEDGAYADRSTGCREYFVCEERRVIRRGVCEPGLLFAGGHGTSGGCLPADRTECPPPARSPCYNRPDGRHRDWRDCSSWYECRRERVVSRGSCGGGLVFDGTNCVPSDAFTCEGPTPAGECELRPSGTYQDLESNCTRYFHCEGQLRTMMSCAPGLVFDGARCRGGTAWRDCPSLAMDGCYGRADGRYRARGAGCRGYYACAGGEKAAYACPAGSAFDGDACVPALRARCNDDDYSCSGLADGYHADFETNCNSYFYCEGGDRLATLTCLGGKIFDGRACVDPIHHDCGAPRRATLENGGSRCEKDGFFVQPGTECKSYYFCVTGERTYLTCPAQQVFNGQLCVPSSQYSCPG
ncbi:peritrophin-48-like [Cydia pomonella]|uniref:peritrophin-48-like n=1 Tax=Cydia pomonella TaxID=82600 RepID=UPI002ADE31E7|nr:peritrophin-48-like [Cydia pomonella]